MRAISCKLCLLIACLSLIAEVGVFGAQADPQKAAASADGKIVWYDCKTLLVEGKGWAETKSFYDRLPAKAEGKVPASVWNLSHHSAGLCVRFASDAQSIQVRWELSAKDSLGMPHMPATGVSGVDLYRREKSGKWCFVGNGRPSGASNRASFTVPAGQQQFLLYLPLYNGVTSVAIGIPKESALSVPDAAAGTQRKPIVFYGTSITQGGCASRPGMAFTAIVGRRLILPVINLGFSGSGKMEGEMAELLAELDPSAYVLDCLWNMSEEQVSTRIEPFVKVLRAARQETPIWLAEDCSVRNISPTGKGKILRTIHRKLVGDGVKNVYLLSNEDMLGDDTEGTVDGCHPNDLGMMRQAEAFLRALSPVLAKER